MQTTTADAQATPDSPEKPDQLADGIESDRIALDGDIQKPDQSTRAKRMVRWYRCRLGREQLSELNRRSDFLGAAQTLGFLGLLAASAGAAIYSWHYWPWYVTALLVFINGHFWHFLINGFHELIHESVFRTRPLNRLFLRIFSFLGWQNHHWFWASHTEHHKYTLHPPDDLEVVVPQNHSVKALLQYGLVNLAYPWQTVRTLLLRSFGHIGPGETWTLHLFPADEPQRRRAYFNWARIVLVGHLLIAGAALAAGWWIVLLVFTFPRMFGGWLHTLCNSSQHAGLPDNVPDFRLCCRTMVLNPFLRFLYWHMNYHTEHHMYAGVPCYKLGRLHRLIRHELPEPSRGLFRTWRHIFEVERKQRADPDYVHLAQLPAGAPPTATADRTATEPASGR
ncbi:MAG: fatty acid desaturase [Phycisphaeraceae bacterium]|nr:fatty acid desaturase [Phycisphaeraceae bacterium]